MQEIKALKSLMLSSILIMSLVVGLTLHMKIPTSSVKKGPNEVKGVSTTASQGSLWEGETRLGDFTNELVLPASSWTQLGQNLQKDSLLEVTDPTNSARTVATVAEVVSQCESGDCGTEYKIVFSSEILELTKNKSGAFKLDFAVPRLLN